MSKTSDMLQLAELLASRLCHDFAGPLGALVGILDVAREEHRQSETVALAEQTAGEMAKRLKLLRAAWGYASEELDVAALHDHAVVLTGSRGIDLDLSGLAPSAVFSPPIARLVLNILLLAVESLSGKGKIALSGSPDAELLITIAGPRAAWPEGFAACLANPAVAAAAIAKAGPRELQAPLTALLVQAHGWRLAMLIPAGPSGDEDTAPPLLLASNHR